MSNMFDVQRKEVSGKVIVRTRPSPLVEGSTIRHVVRNTADDAVVATRITEHTDMARFADISPVMAGFVASVKELMAEGNAVRISGIGTLYLTAKEGEDGGNEFGVGFTPAEELVEAAKIAEAHAVLESESAPVLESVQDTSSQGMAFAGGMNGNGSGNDKLTSDRLACVNGKRLRIAGDTAETGIFLVPVDEYDNYKLDKSDWIRVDDSKVWRNMAKEVMFTVPKASGRYRIAISTKAPLNGSSNETLLLKHARLGLSAAVDVV